MIGALLSARANTIPAATSWGLYGRHLAPQIMRDEAPRELVVKPAGDMAGSWTIK